MFGSCTINYLNYVFKHLYTETDRCIRSALQYVLINLYLIPILFHLWVNIKK